MHMLRIVLLGWPCITSSAGILLWIYLQTSNAFKPILLLYVLQPTVVDPQQMPGGKAKGRELMRETWWGSGTLVSLRMCCLSTIDSEAACRYWLPKITNLRWLYHLPNCRNALSVSLHCFVVVCCCCCFVVVWLAFCRGKFRNGTYTKLIATLIPFLPLHLRRH